MDFQAWPGFDDADFAARDEYVDRLKELMHRRELPSATPDLSYEDWLERKALPEGEAFVVIKREREGGYHIISEPSAPSHAWFISATAAINSIERGQAITWQPEAFLAFAGTLLTEYDAGSADRAFEILLWNLAESGVVLVEEQDIARVFGTHIDQATLRMAEEDQVFAEVLGSKYGESAGAVLARVPASMRSLAALQLAKETLAAETRLLKEAQDRARAGTKAVRELEKLNRYRRKLATKQATARQKARRHQAQPRKRRKR